MKFLSIFILAILLTACANVTPKTDLSGTVNIGGSSPLAQSPPATISVVKTLSIPCQPPTSLLTPPPLLPQIHAVKLTPQQALDLLLDDSGFYNSLRVETIALQSWVVSKCQTQSPVSTPSPTAQPTQPEKVHP